LLRTVSSNLWVRFFLSRGVCFLEFIFALGEPVFD